jgi:hypothetical protein
MRTAIRSALIAASLGACHGSSPAVAPAPDGSGADTAPVVTLERTPCFGSCPVYRVTISRSGLVRYEGKRFVADSGLDTARISSDSVAGLLSELQKGGYFEFDERYVSGAPACGLYATDLPSAITSVDDGSRSKRIQHDHGCNEAPHALAGMENRIDQVAGTSRWIDH